MKWLDLDAPAGKFPMVCVQAQVLASWRSDRVPWQPLEMGMEALRQSATAHSKVARSGCLWAKFQCVACKGKCIVKVRQCSELHGTGEEASRDLSQ